MVSYNVGWKPGCCLSLFMQTRAKEFVKVFLSHFQFINWIAWGQAKFKLGGVDTTPTYLLFLTIFLLFWTLICMIWMKLTPDQRCFQQNYHGVVFVQKWKFSEWNKTLQGFFISIIRISGAKTYRRGALGWAQPTRAPPWCLLRNLLLVDVVGPPSAEVCRIVGNFPQVDDLRFINPWEV